MDDTLQKIRECIDIGQSFKLEAGAGSGKTWTLIESIKYILQTKEKDFLVNNRKIACITYTNAAAEEIHNRLDNNSLVFVGTIHSFLWSIIRKYTKELKELILEYNESLGDNQQLRYLEESFESVKEFEYNLYKKDWGKGQLWHDDIIRFAQSLFEKRKKLALLTVNQFPYIFVDEYQDTFPSVVNILLDNIYTPFNEKVILGFFGDSMQNIYNTGIGQLDLRKYQNIKKITKFENYRCSKKVINLLQYIRPELKQIPAGNNKEGSISFFVSNTNLDLTKFTKHLASTEKWDLESPKETKILILTHRKIAETNGFQGLLDAFPNKDRFFERGYFFSRILFEIEDICQVYEEGSYGEMLNRLRSNGFRLLKHRDKAMVKEYIDKLLLIRATGTISQVLDFLDKEEYQIIQIKEYRDFLLLKEKENANIDSDDLNIFNAIANISFTEVTQTYNHIEKNTLFSTKHGVKGKEFNNVIVVIDDLAWRQFNDNEVLSNKKTNKQRFNRSRNLLYVCCSRSKNNLVLVSVTTLSSEAMLNIKAWFGKENVFEINN